MKKLVKASLLLMAVLTVIYASAVTYKIGYADGESHARKYSPVKHPTEYDIWRHYFAEKLETEPQEWYTPEELGIILIINSHFEHYDIFIAREHEEKAFAWMRDHEFTPYAVKYEDEFYQILGLWVTPGISGPKWEIPTGIALGAGWVFSGVHFLKGRGEKNG